MLNLLEYNGKPFLCVPGRPVRRTRGAVRPGPIDLFNSCMAHQTLQMISTGLEEVDRVLQGGLRGGIVDVYGAPATGKTQLALQVTKNCISSGGTVLFQDTTGEFRPERLLEMLDAGGLDHGLLESVAVSRVTNSVEQQMALEIMDPADYSLLIIDDITDLFSFDYFRGPQVVKKNRLFVRYMMRLSRLSLENDLSLLVTNTVRSIKFQEQETMARAMDLFTHVKIHLSADVQDRRTGDGPRDIPKTARRGTVMLPGVRSEFCYSISTAGLEHDARPAGDHIDPLGSTGVP